MSDSSEEDVEIEVPYSSRPEWSDVKPINQDEETNDIVRIAYTESFKEVYGYFRAILKLNEKSERAFELTHDAALLNPANYTVWYFRRILLKELNKDLNEELEFITDVIYNHPKNYQVWQHRRNIVDLLKDPSQELHFSRQILKKDSKNYHAWQYRQWIIKTYNLWSTELEYVNELIDADIRNNSAWNQRYFYFNNQFDLGDPKSVELIESELEFCLTKLRICSDNESVWNYLKAFTRSLDEIQTLNANVPESRVKPRILEFCRTNPEHSPFALSYLVDTNLETVDRVGKEKPEEAKCLLTESIEMLESLASKHDTIRANYWTYMVAKVKKTYSGFLTSSI